MKPIFCTIIALIVLQCSLPFCEAASCPCDNPDWCQLIFAPPRKEVFAFHVSDYGDVWKQYNWSLVTTVCVFGDIDPQLMCYAHSQGARVTVGMHIASMDTDTCTGQDFPENMLGNETFRKYWIGLKVAQCEEEFLDGINLDIEGNSADRNGLSKLTEELYVALKTMHPFSQLTFDTVIYPTANSPGYDYVALANYTDFLFPMAYDMCWGTKVASANTPIRGVESGIFDYFKLGIPAEKIVLGLPWYGYDFPCTTTDPTETVCNVSEPFTGSWQISYVHLLPLLAKSTTGLLWDAESATAYFNYVNSTGSVHQIWFDDPKSLSLKYYLAGYLDLRGVGFWTADFLPYNTSEYEVMWDAVESFFT